MMAKLLYIYLAGAALLVSVAHAGNVIVIGASAGIGREITRVFCKNGYKVGGIARNESALQALQQELGDNFVFKVGDIRTAESIEIVKQLIQQMGGCDIFVMNAGIWQDSRNIPTVEGVESLDWKQLLQDQFATIDTNITGFTRMAATALEYFIQQKKGHFVGVSSVDAVRGNPACPVYSGTKGFESLYMQGWRAAFEQTGVDITITDIRPGYIETYEVGSNAFWVEKVGEAAEAIFDAVIQKKKVAYIKGRWGLFAAYLSLAPDSIYNYMAMTFGVKNRENGELVGDWILAES